MPGQQASEPTKDTGRDKSDGLEGPPPSPPAAPWQALVGGFACCFFLALVDGGAFNPRRPSTTPFLSQLFWFFFIVLTAAEVGLLVAVLRRYSRSVVFSVFAFTFCHWPAQFLLYTMSTFLTGNPFNDRPDPGAPWPIEDRLHLCLVVTTPMALISLVMWAPPALAWVWSARPRDVRRRSLLFFLPYQWSIAGGLIPPAAVHLYHASTYAVPRAGRLMVALAGGLLVVNSALVAVLLFARIRANDSQSPSRVVLDVGVGEALNAFAATGSSSQVIGYRSGPEMRTVSLVRGDRWLGIRRLLPLIVVAAAVIGIEVYVMAIQVPPRWP